MEQQSITLVLTKPEVGMSVTISYDNGIIETPVVKRVITNPADNTVRRVFLNNEKILAIVDGKWWVWDAEIGHTITFSPKVVVVVDMNDQWLWGQIADQNQLTRNNVLTREAMFPTTHIIDFNADFDGDEVIIHQPIKYNADFDGGVGDPNFQNNTQTGMEIRDVVTPKHIHHKITQPNQDPREIQAIYDQKLTKLNAAGFQTQRVEITKFIGPNKTNHRATKHVMIYLDAIQNQNDFDKHEMAEYMSTHIDFTGINEGDLIDINEYRGIGLYYVGKNKLVIPTEGEYGYELPSEAFDMLIQHGSDYYEDIDGPEFIIVPDSDYIGIIGDPGEELILNGFDEYKNGYVPFQKMEMDIYINTTDDDKILIIYYKNKWYAMMIDPL